MSQSWHLCSSIALGQLLVSRTLSKKFLKANVQFLKTSKVVKKKENQMTVILPHKKSLKGMSYVKQVARRLYMVREVAKFQMKERPYKVQEQRISLPVAHGRDGREG